MDNYSKFISTYKELEMECREKGIDIKELEEKLDEDNGDKLRMCRYFRNFIQHNKGFRKFLSVSDGMQEFLEKTVYKLQMEGDVCKKHLLKVNMVSCDVNDKQQDIIGKFVKARVDHLLVFQKGKLLGLLSIYDAMKMGKTGKIKSIKKLSKNYEFVDASEKIENLEINKIYICKEGDKILGVVKI